MLAFTWFTCFPTETDRVAGTRQFDVRRTTLVEVHKTPPREKLSYKKKLKEYTENLEKLVEEKSRKLVEAERLAAVGQTVAGLAHAIKNITAGLAGGMYVLEKGIDLENRIYLGRARNPIPSRR